MMQQMRNPKTLKVGLWALLALVIPSFVFFYGFGTQGPSPGPSAFDSIAFVTVKTGSGKHELNRYDLQEAQRALAQQYAEYYALGAGLQGPVSGQPFENSLKRKEIAEYAASRVAFDDLADESGIYVSRQYVADFLTDMNWTEEVLQAQVRASGKPEGQFIRDIQESLRLDRARNVVSRLSRVSLLEMWQEYRLQNDRVSLEWVEIPVSRLQAQMETTDDEIATYYEENKESYIEPEKRVYRYVMITPEPVGIVQIEDEELQTAYDAIDWESPAAERFKQEPGQEIRHILLRVWDEKTTETVRQQIEELKGRLESGEQFDALANEYTEDVNNLSEGTPGGGVVPTRMNEDTMEELIADYGEVWAETLFGMQEGETSGIIESRDMLMIARVEKVYEEQKTFDELRSQLTSEIRAERMEAEREKQTAKVDEEELRLRRIVAEQTTLEGIAAEVNVDIQVTSPIISTRTSLPTIGSLASNQETVQSLETGVPSPVMRTDTNGAMSALGDRLVVLEISEVQPERPQTLDEARRRVDSAVKRQKAVDRAREISVSLKEKLTDGIELSEAASEFETDEFKLTPGNTPAPVALSEPPPVFSASRQKFANEMLVSGEGDVIAFESGSGEFVFAIVVARVLEHLEPDQATFLGEMAAIEREFNRVKSLAFVEEWRRDALKRLNPDYNEDYIAEDDPRVARRRARRGS